MTTKKPELVCPAGDWASLTTAVDHGADCLYFGVKGINMRHYAANFDPLELPKVMSYIKKNNKRGYLTLNTIFLDEDIPRLKKILVAAKSASVDAVVCWDASVITIASDMGLPIHISTQASVSNFEALRFFVRNGAKRVVLARECSLANIRSIIEQVKKWGVACEIETFIHGAMCVSISGRCFLSQYSFGTSANQGQCFQPCRHEYEIHSKEGDLSYLLGQDYVLSPKDLCSIDFLDQLIASGIDAFKIEGRMRPAEYVRETTVVYRQAIDACFDGGLTEELKNSLKARLAKVYNRGFSSGFYFGRPDNEISRGVGSSGQKEYIGEVRRFYKRLGVAEVRLTSAGIKKGDCLLFTGKTTGAQEAIINEIQQEHLNVEAAAKGSSAGVKIPFRVNAKDKVFLLKNN